MSPFSLANLKCYLKIAENFHSHENVLCLHTPIHKKRETQEHAPQGGFNR